MAVKVTLVPLLNMLTSGSEVTLPASVAADDIIVIIFASDGDISSLASSGGITMTEILDVTEGNCGLNVLVGRASGSETTQDVTWTGSQQGRFMALRISGVDNGIAIADIADIIGTEATSSAATTLAAPAITTGTDDTLAIAAVCVDRDRLDSGDVVTWTSGTDVGVAGSSGGANGAGLAVAEKDMASGGGTLDATFGTWASDQCVAIQFNILSVAAGPTFDRSLSDTVTVSSTLSRAGSTYNRVPIPNAALSITEQLNREGSTYNRQPPTEALGTIGVTLTRTQGHVRSITDALGSLGETLSRIQQHTRALSETDNTVNTSDTVTRFIEYTRSVTGSVTISDVLSRVQNHIRNLTESETISDVLSRVIQYFRSLNETVTLSDALSRIKCYIRSDADTVTVSDTVEGLTTLEIEFAETVTVSDDVTGIRKLLRTLSDTITQSDSLTRMIEYMRSLNNTVTVSDLLTRFQAHFRSLSDTISVSDSLTRMIQYFRSLSESPSLSDQVTRNQEHTRSLSDTISVSDVDTRAIGFFRSLADTITVSDALSRMVQYFRSLSNTVSISEVLSRAKGFFRSLSDTISVSDVLTGIRKLLRTLSDTLSISDTLSRMVAYMRSLSNTVSVSDQLSRMVTYTRSLSDTITTSDVVTRVLAKLRTLTETITVSDTLSKMVQYFRTLTDTISLSDSLSRMIAYFRSPSTNFSLDRLLAYYKFDESSGNVLNRAAEVGSVDEIPNSDLTLLGGFTQGVLGKIKQALSLNGTTGKGRALGASVAEWKLTVDGSKFSVVAWIKFDNFAGQVFPFGQTNGNANDSGIGLRVNTNRTITFDLGKVTVDDFQFVTTETFDNDTTFQFLAFTYDDATGDLKVQINGNAIETSGGHNFTNTDNPERAWEIGQNTADASFLPGDLDEMSVWGRVLSPAEIISLYNAGNGRELSQETVVVSDLLTKIQASARQLVDTIVSSDIVTRIQNHLRTITDTVTQSDTVTRMIQYFRSLAETISISENLSRTQKHVRTILDTQSISDTVSRFVEYTRSLADTISISSLVTGFKKIFKKSIDATGFARGTDATAFTRGTDAINASDLDE